jgi:hypothetical protein
MSSKTFFRFVIFHDEFKKKAEEASSLLDFFRGYGRIQYKIVPFNSFQNSSFSFFFRK